MKITFMSCGLYGTIAAITRPLVGVAKLGLTKSITAPAPSSSHSKLI